jgi:hypothetical protein
MRADITVGSAFPDYELPDHTGTLRRLSELQGEDPMIIVLAREAYSAKDQRQQQGLAELWREMKPGVGCCQLVTITTSDPQETFNYRSGVGAESRAIPLIWVTLPRSFVAAGVDEGWSRAAPQPRARRGVRLRSGAVQGVAQDRDGLGDRGARGVGVAERVEHHEVVGDAVVADGRHGDPGRPQAGRVGLALVA